MLNPGSVSLWHPVYLVFKVYTQITLSMSILQHSNSIESNF